MNIKPLGHITFSSLITCFLKAFEGYFVPMPTDPNYYKVRWNMAKVRYDLSYGMFDGKKLVGFIIHGIDTRNGHCIAFNTGTGVLPEYRGKKIIKSIYEHALKALREKGITKCALEVITENTVAIKAYESVGFKICKNYSCFRGTLKIENSTNKKISLVERNKPDWKQLPNQDFYSWDNHRNSIKNGSYTFYEVFVNNLIESYFIINTQNGYVAQLDVLKKNPKSWHRLFIAIQRISENITINNVDERFVEKLQYIKSVGLINTINQYEMKLQIGSEHTIM